VSKCNKGWQTLRALGASLVSARLGGPGKTEDRRHPQGNSHLSFWGREGQRKEMLKAFLNYGLVAAVIVWAGVVALMAYRLDDSPWRWAFAALAVGGIATVAIIFKIRRYVDGLTEASEEQGSKS
jgi:hypothetical protein